MVGNLGRVSTFGLNDSNIGNIIQSQRQISDLSAQISSGKVARRYEGLADRSNRLVNIENELERTLQYKTNAADVERRLEGMEASLASIIDMGIELKADLVLASNPGNADSMPLAELGRAFFEQAAAFLNLEQDNRYVFGGTKTDRPPVASLEEVTANFREAQANGGALDIANLAGKTTVIEDTDENSSVPLRTLQIIDFFLNDEETGTINTPYPNQASDAYTAPTPAAAGFPDLDEFRANTNAVSFREFYYNGDERELSSKIEDNNDLEYGVKANRKGIEKALLAGWMLADIGNPTPVDGGARVAMSAVNAIPNAPDLAAVAPVAVAPPNPGLGVFGLDGLTLDVGGNIFTVGAAPSDTLQGIANQINTTAGLATSARVEDVPIKPVQFSKPGVALTAGDLEFTNSAGVSFNVNFAAAPANLDEVAATVNADPGNFGVTAVVRTTDSGTQWLEISYDDGSAPNITNNTVVPGLDDPANTATSRQILVLENDDGSTPAIPGGTLAPVLGFTTEGTANSTLDTEDRVEVALKLLEDVLQGFGSDTLSAVRSDVGTDLAKIETVKERYNAFELFHEEVQVEIENTDIATAATQLSQSQLILESSFLAISSISRLSLANFLR